MKRLIEFFINQGRLVEIITLAVILVGIGSIFLIKRETFPNLSFDVITVTTIYPGAAPEEVEKLITNPIEQALQEVDGIKKLTSVSTEGRSFLTIELDVDQTTDQEAKTDIEDAIDAITDLPVDIEDPIIRIAESKQQPIIEVSLSGDIPEMELRQIAREMERKIELLPGVANVKPRGMRDLEIRVEADPLKLERFSLGLEDVVNALKTQNISIPGGTVEAPHPESDQKELSIRTSGEFTDTEEIKKTVIRANDLGQPVRVGQIAEVHYDLEKVATMNRTAGFPSISLTVLKKESADAISVVDDVKALVESLKIGLKPGVRVDYVNDLSFYIRRRLGVLTTNLMIGLILVLIFLTAILPFRVAAIVSMGIPFAFFGTMILFFYFGISINLLTLMGLIIVAGMLVDDAIVVVDNIARRISEGEDPKTASVEGTHQVWGSVAASVMTTIIAFLPMMFMSGIFGKFTRFLPIGVILALIVSLLEAYFILPRHAATWLKSREDFTKKRVGPIAKILSVTERLWDQAFVPRYMTLLKGLVTRRYWVGAGTVLFFFMSLFVASKMRFILFPARGVEIFFVRGETAVGTSLDRTAALTKEIEKVIATLPKEEMENFTTQIGIQQQDINDPTTKLGSHYSQVSVYLTPETERTRTAEEIVADLRSKLGTPPGFEKVAFERVNPGPPVGKPISIGVRGDSYDQIIVAANDLKKRISEIPGVTDVDDSLVKGKDEIHVKLNLSETAAAGLNVAAVGGAIRTAYEGTVATTIRKLDEEIDVRVLYPQENRSQEKSLETLKVRSPRNFLIPFSEIGSTERHQGFATIEHEKNRRQVRVLGNVNEEMTTSARANDEIRKFISEFETKYPHLTFHFGGEDQDSKESMRSLSRAFLIAAIGIFIILVLTFNSITQPLLVVLTIPTGMMAIIWTFFLHGEPLTFLSLLGVIALAGVIVNNAIVFVDFVNQNRKNGMDRFQSIFESARMRIRPIFLTTVTTVAGLLPTAYGWGGLDPFVVPIALALGWGMLGGSILTAIIFPAALAIMDDIVGFFFKKSV